MKKFIQKIIFKKQILSRKQKLITLMKIIFKLMFLTQIKKLKKIYKLTNRNYIIKYKQCQNNLNKKMRIKF